MKVGVSYNVFDGVELLSGSILSLKNQVDYISVVYQNISNHGFKSNDSDFLILQNLLTNNLINDLILYTPDLKKEPWFNETNKRNIGLDLSKKNGCTHHISLDCDEYYIDDEVAKLKKDIIFYDYDTTFIGMYTYYKSTKYVLTPKENYYVPFIHKIKPNTMYVHGTQTPVLVDPTRRVNTIGKYYIVSDDSINMHHLSHIRLDYESKLRNSSAYINYENKIKNLINIYKNFTFQENMCFPNDVKYKLTYNNNDKFNIEL